jgi:uncharacterized hydrophobic protein (TIGR00271 family)
MDVKEFFQRTWVGIRQWLKGLFRKIPQQQLDSIRLRFIRASSPKSSFFFLVVLSSTIATLGLIINSAAVIIGAMLLAPLMTPLIGIGLAIVTSDFKMLRNAFAGLLKGFILAVGVALLVTLANRVLPFVSLGELSSEILARTRPSPLDMAIALSGGLAAAYATTEKSIPEALPGVAIATALMPPLSTVGIGFAMGQLNVAFGALLLFTTNAVTIAFASALIFFLRGFRPKTKKDSRSVLSNLYYSGLLLLLLLIPLSFYSVRFVQEANENRLINDAITSEINKLGNVEMVSMNVTRDGKGLNMDITIRTSRLLSYDQVVAMQEAVVQKLGLSVSLNINQVLVQQLNPLIPPTPTATFLHTRTPTATATGTPLPSSTPTTNPTPTQTLTPTPETGVVHTGVLPPLYLYQQPGGPIIGALRSMETVTILYGRQIYNGLEWVEVEDAAGRVGWIPSIYLETLVPTASTSPALTATP